MKKKSIHRKIYKWVVEFQVKSDCVANGFNLTNADVLQMLSEQLEGQFNEQENNINMIMYKAKIIRAPSKKRIAKEQGY